MSDLQKHWDNIFLNTEEDKLGWFENDLSQTLKYLERLSDLKNQTIFLSGAGTSRLADVLYQKCDKLIVNDISEKSLAITRDRIGTDAENIEWLNADVSQDIPLPDHCVDFWIDRAVLHFLTSEEQINGYFKNLKSILKPSGCVLMAQFSETGAEKCAGLEVHRYSLEEMVQRFGSHFQLTHAEKYTFINPYGSARPYLYTFFKKVH